MSSTRVLFVDDEPHVLDALRNVLRKQRHVWDMTFALGGPAALDELERGPCDVIVTDMRMPGMDGAELLQQVKDRFPSVARIVLSGHAESAALFRALGVAHQYTSKPCDPDQLIALIDRTASLQALVRSATVRRIVGSVGRLPSVPQTYLAMTQAATRPETTLDDVADIVERDTALVAKVLQIVNSAYFGARQRLTSIRQAVQYLGTDTIRGLALTGHAFGTLHIRPMEGFSLESLQRHSVLTAQLAKRLGRGQVPSDDVFTAAMVHDIGEIVLACAMPQEFAEVRRTALATGRPVHEVELEMLGASHTETGAYLLGIWGLPFGIIEVAAYHHRPELVSPAEASALALVHLADVLIDAAAGESSPSTTPTPHLEFLRACGVEIDVARWGQLAREIACDMESGAPRSAA